MFTINELKRYCSENTFRRIERSFNNGDVYGYTYDDTNYPFIKITGDVYDELNDFFMADARAVIDYENGFIRQGFCECRYLREKRKACIHLFLLVYAFLIDIKNGTIQVGPKNRKTDYVLSEYLKGHLNAYEIEEKIPDRSGAVTIKPEIQISDNNID